MKKSKYNFIQTRTGVLSSYYDRENVVSLTIFKSGWSNLYECILELGEYGTSQLSTLTPFEIQNIYGIKTFLIKEKLKKINSLFNI
jgi:hypothetical protein